MGVKYLKKKEAAVLVFIILIATSIMTVSGHEYIENIEKEEQSIVNNQEISCKTVQSNYVYGYWKLDEGEGNIAYDSSGHNFDGTIYGASWTTGNSSYALDFDGVNDYVSFDDYLDLGFNKTDDMIFSFYINTTSTDFGTIYSASNPYGNVPQLDIILNSTGTIDFSIFVLYCGFTLQTESMYNDGEWHYVEIYYNGITTYPTVKIYVDDELDVELTQWVCNFDDNDVNKFKMGRNSNDSTVFFDGKIDEFKFIKYPGGNDQSPPEIYGPIEGNKSEEYEFSFITNDPEGDDIWLLVDWGDGTDTGWIGPYESGEEVILTHQWSEAGLFKIKAKSMDIWDDGPPSYHEIIIGEQAPNPPVITGPQMGEIDESLEFTFVTNDYEEDDIELFIDWDDGQFENWIGPYASNEEVKVSHAWEDKGVYEIRAKARDGLSEGDWSEPFEVFIGNAPPNKPTITGSPSGKPGVEYTYKFLSTDPDGDNIYYWVSWGDGDVVEDYGPYASGFEIEISHIWGDKGKYVIEAWARDDLGAFGEKSTLEVTMPKSIPFFFNFPLLNWLFERFPNAFQLLRYIVEL